MDALQKWLRRNNVEHAEASFTLYQYSWIRASFILVHIVPVLYFHLFTLCRFTITEKQWSGVFITLLMCRTVQQNGAEGELYVDGRGIKAST